MTADGRDSILVRGVSAHGRHGVLPHEKQYPQPFVVDADLELDLRWAGATDALADSVSYAVVAEQIRARLTGASVDLIERLADLIARDCLAQELVEAVTVTVHKPAAPVGLEFGDVAVRVRRGQARLAVVALGGNLPGPAGGPKHTLASAALDLSALPASELLGVSPLVRSAAMTAPGDDEPQPDYLNAVAVLRTDLHPRTLLAHLHRIEADHGRVRERSWGPRTLDLDLIDVRALGAPRLESAGALRLPHPGAGERDFVLQPWAGVDPAGAAQFRAELAGEQGVEAPTAPALADGPPWPRAVRRWVRVVARERAPGGAP
ncbi:dihydroneopterin aldolase/2-amino-4-hydroxy-6-hydroxymethyldihydropteridine diphosphokinase [Kineosphaera limosa]|uniref:Bifunctional folate synthesis protein n=1 Tax=Kineosphaera limosa NBRC 100340 TaxID=1184609 RepID=K6XGM4_9MICO|nr:dihydroneopterin aldolase [Kineosphaera limosa]NYE01697.1 dihydroneopterin aldolase/2-amino-4-hydroxy-6-hydroxymethyldihydropteridine diphosphokinase [Kineosphaera limosa]GAB97989.1 dihydroneopterin aldolase/2-amino-4-hydroxy-6-hydroxymethyldihydropteridine pyrophosphokinase [Kineosphaera limosa NBRC 100340]